MTKAELIEELNKYPDYYEVSIRCDRELHTIEGVYIDWNNNSIEISD